jgi:deoxycytidine triphosphate deaminase
MRLLLHSSQDPKYECFIHGPGGEAAQVKDKIVLFTPQDYLRFNLLENITIKSALARSGIRLYNQAHEPGI